MRILYYELRKLWRPAQVLAALTVLMLFGRTSIGYYLYTLPQQSADSCVLDICTDWRERYGVTLDPDELPGVRAQLDGLIAEADERIAHWEETKHPSWASFAEGGVTDFAEYCALLEKTERDRVENEVAALLLDSRTDFLYYRIRFVRGVLERYGFEQTADPAAGSDAASPGERARCAEIAADPAVMHSILYSYSIRAANEFAVQLALSSLMLIALMVSPCLVRERLARMAQEQWPTHTGRAVLRYQLAAALVTSAVIPVGMAAAFGWKFCKAWRADVFWDCIAYSVGGSPVPWFTMTYGQYLLTLGGVLVCLGTACGAAMFFLSRFSGNYVAMLLKALPGYLAFAFAADKILSEMLYFGNYLSGLTGVPGIELIVTAALLCGALALNAAALRRERKREQM